MGVRVQSSKAGGSGAAPGGIFKAALHSGGWGHCALTWTVWESAKGTKNQIPRKGGMWAAHAAWERDGRSAAGLGVLRQAASGSRHLGTMVSADRMHHRQH